MGTGAQRGTVFAVGILVTVAIVMGGFCCVIALVCGGTLFPSETVGGQAQKLGWLSLWM